MLSSINLIVLQIIFLYYISNSNVTAVDDNSTKSLESAASFGNWVRDKTGDEQTVITDVSGSNVEDVDRNVDHDEGSFKFPLPTTEVSDHAKSTDIFSQWFAFPKSDMIESSNPIEDVNKWKRDGHSTSNESDSEVRFILTNFPLDVETYDYGYLLTIKLTLYLKYEGCCTLVYDQ
ncbi:unnamed protein product [Meloidogyne enterolobii]|uniref:Uncharacterized protein n=1 Tax=Meloidogyne enterolobii TaxID=390850 RepID=A0ACB0YE28_MELEN